MELSSTIGPVKRKKKKKNILTWYWSILSRNRSPQADILFRMYYVPCKCGDSIFEIMIGHPPPLLPKDSKDL